MTTGDLVMVIEKDSFTVRLHKNLLEVDLREGFKKKLEDALETNPTIRKSLGLLFQSAIPLDVPLKDIESAKHDNKGQVKIKIPHRKDITIKLDLDESIRLVDKLNQLVPIEKQREVERIMASREARKELAREATETRETEPRYLGTDRD